MVKFHALSAAFAAILLGCSPHPLNYDWPKPVPLGRDVPIYTPPRELNGQDDPLARSFEEPREELTLREAMAAALLRNSELASFGWEIRATEARALQASLLPNPGFGVEVENIGGSGGLSGFDGAETTLSLSQAFLLGGKIKTRTQLASLEQELSGFNYETKRIDVLTEVTKRFVDVLAAQRRVEIAEEAHNIAEQVLETVIKRVDAGDVSPVEKSRSSVIVSTSRLALVRARRELKLFRTELSATWSSTAPQFQAATGPFQTVHELPPASTLAQYVSQNPEIARWAVEMSKNHVGLQLAKAEAVPDVEVEAGVRHINDADGMAFVIGLSLPLPFFDRNQGGVLEARYNLEKAREERQAAEVRVRAALSASYQQLAATYTEATLLTRDVLPAARTSFEATRQAFTQGKLGYLDVLDAQRTLIDIHSQQTEALVSYHRVLADVERLIGQPLAKVTIKETSEVKDTTP